MRFSNRFIVGVHFNVFLHPAQFVGKAEHDADTPALIDFNVIHQLNQNIPCQLVDVLELPERNKEWIFHINAILNFLLLGLEPFNNFFQSFGLMLIIRFQS